MVLDKGKELITDLIEDKVEDFLGLDEVTDEEVKEVYGFEFLDFLDGIPDVFNAYLVMYKDFIIKVLLAVLGVGLSILGINVAHKLEGIPLFGSLFELVGLFVVGKFTRDNLLNSTDRAALLERLAELKEEYLG